MTISISNNNPRVSYSVNESATQTSFAVSFEFFAAADLNVYVDGTLKTITTHYTVTGGDGSTGTVAMSVTGATGGSTVVITRDITLERTTDFPVSGAFQVETLNTELDRFIAIQADIEDDVSRSIKLADEDATASMELPLKAARLGKVLTFHETTGAAQVQDYITSGQAAFLNNVTAGTVTASKALVVDSNRDLTTIRNLTSDGTITASSFVIGSASINEANLEAIDDVTAGTVAASKAVVVDANKDISAFRTITSQSLNLTLNDDSNATGPILDFTRITASPANNDYIMNIRATSKDSGGNDTEYGRISVNIHDPTNGNEDGAMSFMSMSAGSLGTWLTHNGDSFQTTNFYQNVTFAANKTVYVYNGIFFPDDKTLKFGNNETDPKVTVTWDEAGTDTLHIVADDGDGLGITLSADNADDNGDSWKLNVADGGEFTLANNTSGSQVTKLTLTTGGALTTTGAITSTSTINGTTGTFTSINRTDNLEIISTNSGADSGPQLILNRQSSSPADDDTLGIISFKGKAEIGGSNFNATYAHIFASIVDHEGNSQSTFSEGSLTLRTQGNSANTNTTHDYVFKSASLGIPHKTIIFEGETADAHETSFVVTEPTADRTITFKDGSGTVAFTSDITAGGIASLAADTTPELGGNLDVLTHSIVTGASNRDINLDPHGSGKVTFKGNGTKGAGQFVLNCENNSHGITIKGPPHSAEANYTLTLPNTDGNANEVLKTDGSGNLDWVAQSSGGISTGKAIAMAMIFG